jgi:hypothetical protein
MPLQACTVHTSCLARLPCLRMPSRERRAIIRNLKSMSPAPAPRIYTQLGELEGSVRDTGHPVGSSRLVNGFRFFQRYVRKSR